MSTNNSTRRILASNYPVTRPLIKILMLLLISIGMHNDILHAQTRQQFLEKRKLVSDNRNSRLYSRPVKSNIQLSNLNRNQCEFTLDSVHAINNPLSQIIQSLAGSGITISNIQTNVPAYASTMYGSFSCGSAAKLGIESGLVLTTGSVDSAKGPNDDSGMTGDHQLLPGFPNDGYPLLDAIAGGDGHDAIWVSFDIVSNSDSIKFDYVFASEEYKEFVNSQFNDVFGFFISGPGITGTKNLAVLPNSTDPVTINSINHLTNSQYYIDNDYDDYLNNGLQIPPTIDATRFFNFQYDGLTVVLTARTQVQPGQTYHLILAIEDVGDWILDAGVFIGGGSITSGSCIPSVTISSNPNGAICAGTNVTFTATPTNGGTTPAYQWKLNGNNVGTNSNTYQNSSLINGDKITCVLTSNASCASPTTATSNEITMIVITPLVPSVLIAADPNGTICAGTNVTFTATPTNGGATPAYQWKLNGNNVGTNSNTYSNNALVNGDIVTVVMTSSLACTSPTTATSTGITMIVTATVVPSVNINANPGNTICTGTNVSFTAIPTNGGTPSYQWKLNGANVGTNSNTYSNNALANGDIVSVILTSSLACASPTTATSTGITMIVTAAVVPSVSISANPGNTICIGTNVTFTATPTNGGTPSYQWKLNGNNVGTNSNTYSNNALANGDVVTIVMTSSLACASPTTATSTGITMTVTSTVAPSVTISANPGNTICTGTNVTFTATPTNGGTPSYQWKLNGNNVGTNSNTYSSNALANGDVVAVVMTSSLACASPTTATSNEIAIVITASVAPTITISANPGNTICTGTNVTFTATPTNGGTPSYQWKLNGNNVGTNSNTYSNNTLANGDIVTVVLTSSLACASPTTATSNGITIVTSTVTPSVSIVANPGNIICIGTNVTFTATPANGGTPSYQWKLNGSNVGTNSNTYSNNALVNGDAVTVVMTSSLACASPTTATSNAITMVVTGSVTPSVNISANPGNTICSGTNVTFTATPTNGGTPSFQWKLNGSNVGTNSNTYSNNALANGDVVAVVMTSSLGCANPTFAISNEITMTVSPSVSAGIVSGVSPICIGQTATFTSNGTFGGTWSSSNTSIATVNSSTGAVTVLSTGTIDIVYTVTGPCNTVSASRTLTVDPNVSAGVVSGVTSLSIGATALYTSTGTSGGSWSSTNNGIATVNSSTGSVVAISAGTTNITYTVASGCGSPVSAFQALTVTNITGVVSCGPKNSKVVVCHNGEELCVAPAAVPAHLAHGDIQGHCPTSKTIVINENESEKKLIVTAYPNPFETVFKLNIYSPLSGPATIEFYNISGVKIHEMKQNVIAGKSIATDVKALNSFTTSTIYKVSIGKYQTTGIIFRPQ